MADRIARPRFIPFIAPLFLSDLMLWSASNAGQGTIGSITELDRRAAMPDALRCFLIVAKLGEHDVVDEALWVSVIEREQARLHLHHDPVSGQEDMVHVRQRPAIAFDLARFDRDRPGEILAIAAPENLYPDRQLITCHGRLAALIGGFGHVIGIDVDQLHHPIAVGAAGGRIALGAPTHLRRVDFSIPLQARGRQAVAGPRDDRIFMILDQGERGDIYTMRSDGSGDQVAITHGYDAYI